MYKISYFILFIFFILSIIVITKLSSLPIFHFIPEDLYFIFISDKTLQDKYSLIYDISIGYTLSSMFYFITIVLPDFIKFKRGKTLIENNINDIIMHMERVLSLVIQKYNCNKDIYALSEKDFLVVNDKISDEEEISYIYSIFNKKSKLTVKFHEFGIFNKIIAKSLNTIHIKLESIKKYESFYASNCKLVECFSKIEKCRFIECYKEKEKRNLKIFELSHTSAQLEDFLFLYKDILSFGLNTKIYTTTIEDNEETLKYRKKRESRYYIELNIKSNYDREVKIENNPSAIFFSDDYFSRLISSHISRTFKIESYCFSDINDEKFSKLKYKIVIISKKDQKINKKLVSKICNCHNIFLIYEKYLLNKRCKFNKYFLHTIEYSIPYKFTHKVIFNMLEPSKSSIEHMCKMISKKLYDI